MGPKLLLITRYFPPLDSIATMRMHSWAYYLKQLGYQVSVLTTTKHNQVRHPLLLDTNGIELTELPYFDPVSALGGDQSKGATSSHKWLHRFYRTRMNERMPNRTDLWIRPALKELRKRYAAGIRYDYLISSYGPPSSHIVGCFAKKIFNCPWLADYRDLWIENHAYKGLWPFTWLERRIERHCVGQADAVTTVSEGLRQVLAKKFPHLPCHVVTNGFEPKLMDSAAPDFFPDDGAFRMVYTGKICHGQCLEPLFAAIAQLIKESKLRLGQFEVCFYGSSMAGLLPSIEKYGLHVWVRYGGVLSLTDAYRAQRSAHALLFLERPEVAGILTGKLFEYLYADAPIMAIGVTPHMESGRLILDTGSGIVCGEDVGLIKQAILDMVQGAGKPEKQREKIALFSREVQAQKLHQILAGLRK